MSREKIALLAVRIALGVFFIFEGWDKLPWMTNPGLLATALQKWADTGVPISRSYIETILIPGVSVFARLVFLGEVATGLALLSGVVAACGNYCISHGTEYPLCTQQYFSIWIFVEGRRPPDSGRAARTCDCRGRFIVESSIRSEKTKVSF